MKKYNLLIIILFISVLSHAQYDFLKESLKNISSAPSFLVIKIKSPSYKGESYINSIRFPLYFLKNDSLKSKEYQIKYQEKWHEKYWESYTDSVYYAIEQGKYFNVSAEDFETYDFEKIIVNDSVLNISKKGIEFFIRTYFDNKGEIIPPSSQNEPYDFGTIIKVMFDAGIQTGIGSEYSFTYIQDRRFYKDGKFVIPPEYRDSKE